MLDTRSHPPVIHSTEGFDYRIDVRRRPSFGLGSLRSRGRLLGIGTVLFLVVGLFYVGFRPTTYTASSQLLVFIKQILTGPDMAVLPGRADLPLVQNQIELLRSGNVLTKVIEALQLNKDPEFAGDHLSSSEPQKSASSRPSAGADEEGSPYVGTLEAVGRKLRIRQVGTSHLVAVSFKASDPEKAARIVNSVIRIYLQELSKASDVASKAPTLRELYQSLGPSAQVIFEAEPPVRADGPPAALVLIAAALFGFCAAAAVALFLDAINDTIRSASQMEYVLGLECLGVVHNLPNIDVCAEDSAARSLIASESQVLRRVTATMLDASSRGLTTIGVTSTLPGEGVTTLAIGLAQAMAVSGKRVLLIDAVPENPSISRWVANLSPIPPRPIAGTRSSAFEGLVRVRAGLNVLPLAELSGRGAHLMRRGLLDEILRGAEESYDFVIVDMPSLVAGPDVRAAAQSMDGFVLVVKWGVTKSELVRQAFQSTGQAQQKFVGTVLTMADEETMKRYGYELPTELKIARAS